MPQANFTDPSLAAGVGNIVEALFGNPGKAASHRINTLQGDKLQQSVSGRQRLSDYYAASKPGDPLSSQAIADAVLGGIGGQDVSGYNLALNANNPGTPEEAILGALVGTGKTIGQNDAVTLGGQNRIRADNERMDDERVGMRQAGAMERAILGEEGALERSALDNEARLQRQNMLPVQTSAGGTTTFVPGDERAPDGSVFGQPTKSVVQGQGLQEILDGLREPTETNMRASGAASAGSGGQTNKVSFSDHERIREQVQAMFGNHPDMDGAEDAKVDPGLEDAVVELAARNFQQHGNGPLAIQEAVSALTQIEPAFDSWMPFDETPARVTRRDQPSGGGAGGPTPGATGANSTRSGVKWKVVE